MAAPTDKAPTDPFVAPDAAAALPNRCVFPGCQNYAAKSESGPQMYMCYGCLVEYMTWRASHGNPVYEGESLSDLFPHEQFVTYIHSTKKTNLPPREADPYFDALKCATSECQIRVQRPQTMCAACLQVFINEQQHSQRQETPAVVYPRNPYGVPLNQAEPVAQPEAQPYPAEKEAPAPPAPEVQRLQIPQTVALQRFGTANKCRGCDTLVLNGRQYCVNCSQNHGVPIWRAEDKANVPLYAPHVPASEIIHPNHSEPTLEGMVRMRSGGGDSKADDGIVQTLKEFAGLGTKFVGQLKARQAAKKAAAAESA